MLLFMRRAANAARPKTAGIALMIVAAFGSASTRATTLWRTAWTLEAPPTFTPVPWGTSPALNGIAFADNGDVLIGTEGLYGYADEFVTRFGTDGTLRWSGVVHPYQRPAAIVPLPDGGAYATFNTYGGSGGYAARFDATGRALWARNLPAYSIVPIDANRVAVSDCESVSMLDAGSGVVIWSRIAGSGCDGGGLVVDGSTIYVTSLQRYAYPDVSQRLAAFDLDGGRLWQTILDIAQTPGLIGLGGDQLYLHTSEETIAIRTTDGSIAWRVPQTGWNLAGAAREPVVSSSDGIQRLGALDGHALWDAAVGSYAGPVSIVGDAIIVVTSNGLSRVDAESGVIGWTVPLPGTDPQGNSLHWDAIGGLAADGTFTLVAHAAGQVVTRRFDFATGAPVGSAAAPSIPQGIQGYSVREGSDIVGRHLDGSNVLRMIDVDKDTGEIRWNVATQLARNTTYVSGSNYRSAHAIGPTRVAAAVPLNDPYYDSSFGYVEVVAYDRATGAEAWDVSLHDDGETETSVATPIVNADGSVIVSIAMFVPCGQFQCDQQSILKLAAADGSVIWRVDNAPLLGTQNPKTLLALGNDVLVRGPFVDSTATLRRLDGNDGSVQWESDVFSGSGVSNVYRIDDSRIVAFGDSTDAYQWAALDSAAGAQLWTSSAPCAENANCPGGDGIVSPGGDIVLPLLSGADAALAELSDDGNGGFELWPVAEGRSDLWTSLYDLVAESDGTLGFVLQRFGSWMSGASWYGRFDTSAGTGASYQHLPAFPLGPLDDGALVLEVTPADALASRTEFSREDMTVEARGNLAASVTLDRDEVSPGEMLGFHVAVTYQGDVALTGAGLRAVMRWPSGATDLSCSGTGVSNCVLDGTGSDVYATFDIAPGGMLEVSGRILVLDAPGDESQRRIGARVVGPPELEETDTADNLAGANVVQALFANGFDGN